MKIVCFIQDYAPLRYFVNRIHQDHPIDLIVVERPPTKSLWGKIQMANPERIISAIVHRVKKMCAINNQNVEDIYQEYFKNLWLDIDSDIPILYTDNINNDCVRQRLLTLQPDVILDHGTTIVKNSILKLAPLILNLHWGLSPYYRGTFCTNWALMNWDVLNIGVTIHKLSQNIDGGDILVQKNIDIHSDDTVNKINMRLTLTGTDLLIDSLDELLLGQELVYFPQNYSSGFLTLNCQWNHKMNAAIDHIEKNNIVSKMLHKPSRPIRLPIVERIHTLESLSA